MVEIRTIPVHPAARRVITLPAEAIRPEIDAGGSTPQYHVQPRRNSGAHLEDQAMRKLLLALIATAGALAGISHTAKACGTGNCYNGGDSNSQNSSSSNSP